MRITKKMARELLEVLEEVKEEYFGAERGKNPFTEWEQKRERVREKFLFRKHFSVNKSSVI